MQIERIPQKLLIQPGNHWRFSFWTIMIIWFDMTLLTAIGPTLPAFCWVTVFSGLLFWAIQSKPTSLNRYLSAVSAFVLYLAVWQYYQLEFAFFNKVSFFIVLFYAYLLQDVISSNLVGLATAFYYLNYIQVKSLEQVYGTMAGLLITSVSYSVIFHLLRKITRERNNFRDLSHFDALTGVANLSYTLQIGQSILDMGHPLAMIVSDLDRFKQINDTYGHMVGNQVLIQVARLLEQVTEGYDRVVGRLGGDEFVVIIRECDAEQVLKISQLCTEQMDASRFQVDPEIDPITISFSVGTAYAPPGPRVIMDKLLTTADMEMYYNKYENHRINIYSKLELPMINEEGMQLLRVLSEKDMYTYVHSEYTAHYASALARTLGLSDKEAEALYIAGWLHDIGKLLIPNDIIRKTGNLNEEEYDLIKSHVGFGLNILAKNQFSDLIQDAILYHHERWDGQGYPNRVAGGDTPLAGRIMQLADAFSAMRVKRVYRRTLSISEAIEEIRLNAGIQFDPELVSEFIRCIRNENPKKDMD